MDKPKNKGGRPKGSINKYTGKEIISRYNLLSSSDFLTDMLKDMIAAREAGDRRNLVAYQTLFAKYVLTELDPESKTSAAPSLTYEEMVAAAKLAIAAAEQKKDSDDTDKTATGQTDS